jgi:hypothetical protein
MAAKRKPRIPTWTLEEQLAASIEAVNAERNGTQLHFPEPASQPAPPAPPKRPPSGGRVPYDVALRQITKAVTTILRDLGEQWDDDSKQGMVSTVLIAAAKDKKIDFCFDSEAA